MSSLVDNGISEGLSHQEWDLKVDFEGIYICLGEIWKNIYRWTKLYIFWGLFPSCLILLLSYSIGYEALRLFHFLYELFGALILVMGDFNSIPHKVNIRYKSLDGTCKDLECKSK